ncbi:hypothetical protein FHW84_001974 [Dyella sp. SG562]|uniref:hypothetical protein n=1 Tax=unclassified Dyella TaxID=2634549 RepID=UPI00141F1D26|nr:MULTISPECIES: hypothetical protein [unclassified Dyella]NII73402.1 hypothetical protein [Dyella sp. SG562]NKJ22753.1 hypothetical protein [Dyella sp. SG609]
MHRFQRHAAGGCCLIAALALGACGKHEAAPPAAAPAAAASVPARAPATAPAAVPDITLPKASTASTAKAAVTAAPVDRAFRVASVTIGDDVSPDHRVTEAKTRFAPSVKTIYAAVETQGLTDSATLSATWSYLEGSSRQIVSTSQSIATDGPAVTTFEVRNPNQWPLGKYQVVIAVDGKVVSTQDFEVAKT